MKVKLQNYAYKIQLINTFKDEAQTALFKNPGAPRSKHFSSRL